MEVKNEIHEWVISYNGKYWKRRKFERQNEVKWLKRVNVQNKNEAFNRPEYVQVTEDVREELEQLFQNRSEVQLLWYI